MSDEQAKKPVVIKTRPRTDLFHAKYSGIVWCKHEINEDFCAACKKEKVRVEEAKQAKQAAKVKKPKVAKVTPPKPAEEPNEEEIEVRV